MSWVALDDQFHAHPKLEAAGLPATGLYAKALSYCGCYLTDGFVPASWAGIRNAPSPVKRALTQNDLWKRVRGGEQLDVKAKEGLVTVHITGPGFFIPDYLTYNPSKAKVEAERERKRQGGKHGAEARWSHGISDGISHNISDGTS